MLEKASPSVVKLFLQVLDEGVMHDASGRVINFRNTIIFMTSNIGCSKKNIGFHDVVQNFEMKEFFSIEFLNRIDKICTFNVLSFQDIKKIVTNKLKSLEKVYLEKDIQITFSTEVVNKIIEKSNYLEFGARKVDKIIEDTVNSYILDMIIKGSNYISLKELEV